MDARQRGHMEAIHDRNYVDARETLLDAVEALGPHGNAVILVGAQAIYVHTEAEDDSFAISPFTYDADLVLDPNLLGRQPCDSRSHEPGRVPAGRPTETLQQGRPVTG